MVSQDIPLENISNNTQNGVEHSRKGFIVTVAENPELNNEPKSVDTTVDSVIDTLVREPQHSKFTNWSAFFTILAIVGHLINIGTDVATTKLLSDEGNQYWFILTLVVSVLPRIITNAISFYWLWQEDKCRGRSHYASLMHMRSARCSWLIRITSHILLLGPILRYVDLLRYGFKARKMSSTKPSPHLKKCADYYSRYVAEDRDSSLLALIESFLGDALQLVLQIYILLKRPPSTAFTLTSATQIASVVSSLWAIASSMTNYHLALRFAVADKRNLSPIGRVFQFLWRLGMITSRVFVLALFASVFRNWMFVLIGSHWLLMCVWLMCQNTAMCADENGKSSCLTEKLFNGIMAGVLVMSFVNVKEGATRIKAFVYYVIVLAEDATMIIIWHLYSNQKVWYHLPAIIGVGVCFALGIFFMLIYYRCFHPNGKMPARDQPTDLF